MGTDDPKLQIEVTINPGTDRRVGPRRPAPAPAPDPPKIPRITRLMALAIKFQDMVNRGEVRDYADLARLGYVTRARITQIMNLLDLAPDIQEEILSSSLRSGYVPERDLRHITAVVGWCRQRRLWKDLLGKVCNQR